MDNMIVVYIKMYMYKLFIQLFFVMSTIIFFIGEIDK